jgi:LPS sulfotransferase NodH
MMAKHNPISNALNERGIIVPDDPVDFSSAFRAAGVKRTYIICITGRCGSTWLANTMAQLPYCGQPFEYFSEESIPHFGRPDGSGELLQYVQTVAEDRQTSGAFGVKIDGIRLEWLSQICDLRLSFNPQSTAWIDMRRLNIVKQAFSFARAKTSGIWHSQGPAEINSGHSNALGETLPESVADSAVWHEILSIIRTERFMERIYEDLSVRPVRIVYEELLDSKRQVLQRLLAHCFPQSKLKISEFDLADTTQKLAGLKEDLEEISFLERHAQVLNMVYEARSDIRADIVHFIDTIKSKVLTT